MSTRYDRVRKNPLTRSYRVDKLTLAALEATLALYRDPARALRAIPALAQLTAPVDELRRRADGIVRGVGAAIDVCESEASVGGGAFPTARIPSVAIAVGGRASNLEARLRANDPPIVGRVADGRLLLDLRTVFASEDETIVSALRTNTQ